MKETGEEEATESTYGDRRSRRNTSKYISMLDHENVNWVRLNGWGMGCGGSDYNVRNGCGVGWTLERPNRLKLRPAVISIEGLGLTPGNDEVGEKKSYYVYARWTAGRFADSKH